MLGISLVMAVTLALGQGPEAPREAPRFLHEDSVQAMDFSPSGKHLVSAGIDRTIRLWNTATGELVRTIGEHEGRIFALTFSPDGQLLASAGADLKVQLWNPTTGKVVRTLKGHTDTIQALAFNPDGTLLATAALDQTIRLWDPRTGKLVRTLEYPDDRAPALCFGSDGRDLYVGFSPGPQVRRYQVATGKVVRSWPVARNGDLTCLTMAGPFGFAGTASGIVWRFDPENLHPPERVPIPSAEGCLVLTTSPDGKLLLVGGPWGGLDLIEIATLRVIRSFGMRTPGFHVLDQRPRMNVNPRIRSVTFSPTSAFLAAGNQEGYLRLWRLIDLLPPKVLTASRLTPTELQTAWDALTGDAEPAYQALARLATYPEQTLPLLSRRQKPAVAVDGKQVQDWITQLDDDDFDIREKAHQNLRAIAPTIEATLREVQRDGKLPTEAARRVAELLEPLSPIRPDAERLRDQRVVLLLQLIGSPEAAKFLRTLAAGDRASPTTTDARDALDRLQMR